MSRHSRPWRTVFSNSRKRVQIRPTSKSIAGNSRDDGWITVVLWILAAVFGFCLLAELWPWLLIGLIAYGIFAYKK